MTEATFRPVEIGRRALLTATVGAITVSQTVLWGGSAGGGTGGASVTINVRRGQQDLAPEGMAFFAEVSGFDATPPTNGSVYDPTMHDLHYTWTFGDPGEYAAPVNMLPQWKNKNVAYGPFPAHVFAKPGEYRVILTVYEQSNRKSASAFVDIVVRDPSVVVPAATTVVCSSSNNWTGMPAHDVVNRTTTFADAFARLAALKANGALTRLVFRGGDEFSVTKSAHIGTKMRNCHISASGTVKAIFNCTASLMQVYPTTIGSGASISGLEMRGPWDSTTETYAQGYVSGKSPTGIRAMGGLVTTHNCNGSGMWQAFHVGNGADVTAIWSDLFSTNWEDYGMWVSGQFGSDDDLVSPVTSYCAVLGCRLQQDVNALQGANGKSLTDVGNRHGVIRIETIGYLYVDCLDGFSRNGWSTAAKAPADQNIIRDHRNDPRTRAFFTRIMGEGGWQGYACGPNTLGAKAPYKPNNMVLEKFYFLSSARTIQIVGVGCGAATVRNGILHRINVGTGADGPGRGISFGTESIHNTEQNKIEPVRIYNITIVNELDDVQQARSNFGDTKYEFVRDQGSFQDVRIENIIIHRPNFTGGYVGDGPLDDTRLALVPRYLGYRWKNHISSNLDEKLMMDTSFATPPNPWSLWRPLPGSPAIGSATGLVAYDDMLGKIRPVNASRGAIEPAA